MQKPSLTQRLRYAFDNMISKSVLVMIFWSALAALTVIFLIALLVKLGDLNPGVTLLEQFWLYLILTLEPDAPDNHFWSFRLVTLLVIIIGILLIGALVGAITASIADRLEKLRQGHSKVLERDHTVILGWSEQVFTIVSELVVAKAQQPKSHIVVLGEQNKVTMEHAIRTKVGKTGHTKVICRHGSPMEMTDLAMISVNTAKAIIILSPDGEDPDLKAIKTLLAIVNDPHRRADSYHIVMHLQEPKNARVAQIVGHDEIEVVVTTDFIARITAQTSRQSGLATVYLDLLDFNGEDICFHDATVLVGQRYSDALLAYANASVIGIQAHEGAVQLNPDLATPIAAGDQLVIIANANASLQRTVTPPTLDETVFQSGQPVHMAPEHTLILGWNSSVPQLIREIDRYVTRGSTVTVVADAELAEQTLARRCIGLQNQQMTFQSGDTADRDVLDTLPLEQYDHAILVAYSDHLDVQHADAHTLVTLLHVRDIIQQRRLPLSIVSEVLDIRNRNLVTITQADDFVVSEQLISFYLAQVAESKRLHQIFAELFDAEGMEIYLRPAVSYVKAGVALDFYTIIMAAGQRQETAIGYRLYRHANDPVQNFGIVLNPLKTTVITFAPKDRIIVIAQQ